jgi:bifunctional DNA-binding transcriptional regulator/antitoxin component of YhaV-PrlF toxin-antitoxin module
MTMRYSHGMSRVRLSKGGQISVPAAIRRRWGGSTFALEDHGDHVVLRPAPDDPVEAARGALKDLAGDMTSEEMRREARAEEAELEERRPSAS